MCKQIKMIIFSLLVLCLIFVCTKEEKTEISSMECISVEKIEEMIQGKEELKEFPEILYDGNPVALDAKSRTIYIPQSMNDLEWTGELISSAGGLMWEEDPYFYRCAEAIAENHVFHLYCI